MTWDRQIARLVYDIAMEEIRGVRDDMENWGIALTHISESVGHRNGSVYSWLFYAGTRIATEVFIEKVGDMKRLDVVRVDAEWTAEFRADWEEKVKERMREAASG